VGGGNRKEHQKCPQNTRVSQDITK
jgi:hypothetical protein